VLRTRASSRVWASLSAMLGSFPSTSSVIGRSGPEVEGECGDAPMVGSSRMRRVAVLSREYPPDVYGGAGVHVEYLARELANLADVTVHCWGEDRPADSVPPVVAYRAWDELAGTAPELAALQAMSIDLRMAARTAGAEIVHSHTWYANLGG